jgi:HD-GYP domain-containing protein (c-di-GMP phosphodiesterase class II)
MKDSNGRTVGCTSIGEDVTDNVRLEYELKLRNAELAEAYDTTLQGWSRALDLRDHETEGHSQRVTEWAVELAALFKFDYEELMHIRRGAMLHDIGKVGVPDSVLLKPGPLNDEERAVMQQHPLFAYNILSPIAYLEPALDVPYCHHEKWDGTGYPRRLKGEEIPLMARIFSIVDVYDALTSNRPYRSAWSKDKTIQYLIDESGKAFDPLIVTKFIEMLSIEVCYDTFRTHCETKS